MGLIVVLILVAVAAFIFLSKVAKTSTATPLAFIQLALDDIAANNHSVPTWGSDAKVLNRLFATLSPITVSTLDMSVARTWLEGKGTQRDILTFARRAQSNGLSLSQQFTAIYDFTRVLMQIEAGSGDDETRSIRLMIAHSLKSSESNHPATTAAFDIAAIERFLAMYKVINNEADERGITLRSGMTFRGNAVMIAVTKRKDLDHASFYWYQTSSVFKSVYRSLY